MREPHHGFFEDLANRRPPWFWWLLAYVLAGCFTLLCWTLCISIFNHPEKPENYAILNSLNRAPQPQTYSSQSAPKHPISSAKTLRKSYLAFSDNELASVNARLMNSYLTGFKNNTFCCYLQGTFKIIGKRKLTQDDVIPNGFAIQLRAMIQPDEYSQLAPYPLIAEIIFPTQYTDSQQGYRQGDLIELDMTPYFASMLHISKFEQKEDATIIVITTVSLASKIRPPHAGTFDLAPPAMINLRASYPLFSPDPLFSPKPQ